MEARPEGAKADFGCDRGIHSNFRPAVWATSQVKDHEVKEVPKEQYETRAAISVEITKLTYRSEEDESYIISQLNNEKRRPGLA